MHCEKTYDRTCNSLINLYKFQRAVSRYYFENTTMKIRAWLVKDRVSIKQS